MDKQKALEHLITKGYDAYSENGVVMVKCSSLAVRKAVQAELDSIGYKCSYGFKLTQS